LRDVLNRIFQGMTFIPIVQPCPPQCPYQPTYPVYPEITWGRYWCGDLYDEMR
jgi:hypothetical protein